MDDNQRSGMGKFFRKATKENWDPKCLWIRLTKILRRNLRDGLMTRDDAVIWKEEAHRWEKWRDARKDAGSAARQKKSFAVRKEDYTHRFFDGISRRYGLTQQQYLRLFSNQGFKCKCCSRELMLFSDDERSPVVDHCHTTGKVRALLCQRCNMLVGRVETIDSPVLAQAREYLKALDGKG